MEISKADWKLFCERVPAWQGHYMERLAREYVELLTSPGEASDHFWKFQTVSGKMKNCIRQSAWQGSPLSGGADVMMQKR